MLKFDLKMKTKPGFWYLPPFLMTAVYKNHSCHLAITSMISCRSPLDEYVIRLLFASTPHGLLCTRVYSFRPPKLGALYSLNPLTNQPTSCDQKLTNENCRRTKIGNHNKKFCFETSWRTFEQKKPWCGVLISKSKLLSFLSSSGVIVSTRWHPVQSGRNFISQERRFCQTRRDRIAHFTSETFLKQNSNIGNVTVV